jgi:hypothetical protein
MDEAVIAFPDVEIGSYPHPEAPDYRVKITLDGRDAGTSTARWRGWPRAWATPS